MSKSIRPYNDKRQPHGYWEIYLWSDILWYKRSYHNGEKVGYEEWYNSLSGKLVEKTYYI